MAGEPHKIRQHRERGRVLALSHLFDPDPEKPGEICEASRVAPLPEGLSSRAEAARRADFSPFPRRFGGERSSPPGPSIRGEGHRALCGERHGRVLP